MSRKSKVEITAETLKAAFETGKPASMTQLAHALGQGLRGIGRQLEPPGAVGAALPDLLRLEDVVELLDMRPTA